jgi:hypothetical protein
MMMTTTKTSMRVNPRSRNGFERWFIDGTLTLKVNLRLIQYRTSGVNASW